MPPTTGTRKRKATEGPITATYLYENDLHSTHGGAGSSAAAVQTTTSTNKRSTPCTSSSSDLNYGPQFDIVAPEGHGWAGGNRFVHHNDDPESYPPRWLHALRRASEANYAMLGMVEHGDGPRYVHMTGNQDDSFWRLRWLARDEWSARASDKSVIDTVHVQLQQPSDGANRLRKPDVVRACSPEVRALFLHCASAFTSADVLDLVARCPNLTALSLSECQVDDQLLRGIAASACAPRLVGLRLWMNRGDISPEALGALITACSASLAWLDIELAFFDRRDVLNHAAWLAPLRLCAKLRVALLPDNPPPKALGELAAGCPEMQLLSVVGQHPYSSTPLSTLEAFVQTNRLAAIDLHGFSLDAAASDALCAAANRLSVGDARVSNVPLPSERLLKCVGVAELRLRCELTEGEVEGCLARLPKLVSLHLHRSEDGTAPAVIGALDALPELRVLNLQGCLRNYYEYGEEVRARARRSRAPGPAPAMSCQATLHWPLRRPSAGP